MPAHDGASDCTHQPHHASTRSVLYATPHPRLLSLRGGFPTPRSSHPASRGGSFRKFAPGGSFRKPQEAPGSFRNPPLGKGAWSDHLGRPRSQTEPTDGRQLGSFQQLPSPLEHAFSSLGGAFVVYDSTTPPIPEALPRLPQGERLGSPGESAAVVVVVGRP